MTQTDHVVGQILDALKKAGVADRTLVLFTSDNGPEVTGEVRPGAYDRLKATMNVQKPLLAPLAKGQPVGTVTVELDGKQVLETPLVALEDYPEGGFFKRLGDSIMLWFE